MQPSRTSSSSSKRAHLQRDIQPGHQPALRDLLTAALEANLSLTAVGQNDAMKRLTAWAAIVAVPTMVGGIYGMNFRFMPELEWPFGYPLVMGLTIAVCGFLFTRFKRTGWL